MSNTINTKAWQFTRKVITINHNRDVRFFFNPKGGTSTTLGATRGREALRNAMLIYPKDSQLDVMNKQIHFRMVLAKDEPVLAEPESWLIQHGRNIPQLKIIYRSASRSSKSGNYTITIPHFNGTKGINPPPYEKGNTPVVFNLSDRSKIVVNASSEREGRTVINYLLKFVNSRYINNKNAFVLPARTNIKKQRMNPVRGDFFNKGQEAPMTWRVYFKK
ncbi:hypothetical protein [Nodularia sphaerocarpa]|uniref:hypothetical protein n=1 Tax=Nodularia sphaerocarpa TaxID=137816 RepID=UPI001EFAB775|nr:hypothetical protein [Nodularia sphaerocarpa]MDB9374306.1 hypothetical protein [Nodularia sphaerocarpa CS-585]MDB9376462.1 hypothetical protein [Nodularia sphaerocarpa CS-585A2]ULP74142.1 hypothetical protein BDGGKGIB_03805 [Nodularia sphaerocarpa UHCC 0038]